MTDFNSKLIKKLLLKHGSKVDFEENPEVLQDIIRQVRSDVKADEDGYDRGHDRSFGRYDRDPHD